MVKFGKKVVKFRIPIIIISIFLLLLQRSFCLSS